MEEIHFPSKTRWKLRIKSKVFKKAGVEFTKREFIWTQSLDHVSTIFHGMGRHLIANFRRMPARVWFRFLTSGLRVSSVVSAFKQRLGMASWSTLAATRGACCFSVRPLCHLQCLITEMEHTSSCFLLWTQGSISWISLWTIAYVMDIENPRKIGSWLVRITNYFLEMKDGRFCVCLRHSERYYSSCDKDGAMKKLVPSMNRT